MYVQGKVWTRAIETLRKLIKEYPKSEQAREAEAMLKDIEAKG
jgi:outer membrane protein assembly factor BamD (BamD/ComL family)